MSLISTKPSSLMSAGQPSTTSSLGTAVRAHARPGSVPALNSIASLNESRSVSSLGVPLNRGIGLYWKFRNKRQLVPEVRIERETAGRHQLDESTLTQRKDTLAAQLGPAQHDDLSVGGAVGIRDTPDVSDYRVIKVDDTARLRGPNGRIRAQRCQRLLKGYRHGGVRVDAVKVITTWRDAGAAAQGVIQDVDQRIRVSLANSRAEFIPESVISHSSDPR